MTQPLHDRISAYIAKDKATYKEVLKTLQRHVGQNRDVVFSNAEIKHIRNFPYSTDRTNARIYRGMFLPREGKFTTWKAGSTVKFTLKRKYASFSLDRSVSEQFALDKISYESGYGRPSLEKMQRKNDIISIIFMAKCPSAHISLYDYLSGLDSYFNFDPTKMYPGENQVYKIWSDAEWDKEILIFHPIQLKIVYYKLFKREKD